MIVRRISVHDDVTWEELRGRLPDNHLLDVRRFSEHYFSDSQTNSSLWGAFHDSTLAGIIGLEEIDCTTGNLPIRLTVGTNFMSFRPGAGVILYQHWLKQTGWTLTFGGSQDFHKLAKNAANAFRVDIPHFVANRWYNTDRSFGVKNIAKRTRNLIRAGHFNVPKRIKSCLKRAGWQTTSVVQVKQFHDHVAWQEDFLGLRQDASIEYLNWRYGQAPGVYKLFEVRTNSKLLGNIVLSESTNRIVVAFSQAPTARDALFSSLRAIEDLTATAGPRKEVYLACCNSDLQQILTGIGFTEAAYRRPLVILGATETARLSKTLHDWHIDFDIGDNAFRYQFHHSDV